LERDDCNGLQEGQSGEDLMPRGKSAWRTLIRASAWPKPHGLAIDWRLYRPLGPAPGVQLTRYSRSSPAMLRAGTPAPSPDRRDGSPVHRSFSSGHDLGRPGFRPDADKPSLRECWTEHGWWSGRARAMGRFTTGDPACGPVPANGASARPAQTTGVAPTSGQRQGFTLADIRSVPDGW